MPFAAGAIVTGLVPGVKYRCSVQAKSHFGLGPRRGDDLPAP